MITEKDIKKDLRKLRMDLEGIAAMPEEQFTNALEGLRSIEERCAYCLMDKAVDIEELEGHLLKWELDVLATRIYYKKSAEEKGKRI